MNRLFKSVFSSAYSASVCIVGAVLSLLALPLSQTGCDQLPTTIIAPVFNSGLSIPIIDSTITLTQFLGDTSLIRKNSDGNLYLTQEFIIPPIRLGDSLNINPIAVNQSTGINEQNELLSKFEEWSTMFIPLSQLNPALPAGSGKTIFIASEQQLSTPVQTPKEISQAKFTSGSLRLILTNTLPVGAEVIAPNGYNQAGAIISSPGEQDWFIPLNDLQRKMTANSTRGEDSSPGGAIRVPLNTKRLTDQSLVKLTVKTEGSNGQTMDYTSKSGLTMMFRVDEPKIESARMQIKAQDFSFSTDAKLPDGTTIKSADISSFVATLNVRNDMPLSGDAELVMPQICHKQTKQPFRHPFKLLKKGTTEINLKDNSNMYCITPDAFDRNAGNIVTKLRTVINVKSNASSTAESVSENDKITVNGVIGPVTFSKAEGTNTDSKTVRFSTTSQFDIGDLRRLTIQNIRFDKMLMKAEINNGSTTSGVLKGSLILFGTNGLEVARIPLPEKRIVASTINTLDYEFTNLSLPAFPSSVKIDGEVVTENGSSFSVSENSIIEGKCAVSIPLAFSISGGRYSERSELSIGGDIQERKQNVNNASILIEAKNSISTSVRFSLEFFDTKGVKTLTVPVQKGTTTPAISFNAGSKSNPVNTFTRVDLSGDDVSKLLSAHSYIINTEFDSPQASQTLNTNDFLRLKVNIELGVNNR
jgi:hypothetical protein